MTNVNRERVQLIVNALKSGEFKQAQGNLRREDTYCCLGVACEVFRLKTGKGIWRPVNEQTRQVYEFVTSGGLARSGYLPKEVDEWYGFGNNNPFLTDPADGNTTTATYLNDIAMLDLPKIGDAFERMYITNADPK